MLSELSFFGLFIVIILVISVVKMSGIINIWIKWMNIDLSG